MEGLQYGFSAVKAHIGTKRIIDEAFLRIVIIESNARTVYEAESVIIGVERERITV